MRTSLSSAADVACPIRVNGRQSICQPCQHRLCPRPPLQLPGQHAAFMQQRSRRVCPSRQGRGGLLCWRPSPSPGHSVRRHQSRPGAARRPQPALDVVCRRALRRPCRLHGWPCCQHGRRCAPGPAERAHVVQGRLPCGHIQRHAWRESDLPRAGPCDRYPRERGLRVCDQHVHLALQQHPHSTPRPRAGSPAGLLLQLQDGCQYVLPAWVYLSTSTASC